MVDAIIVEPVWRFRSPHHTCGESEMRTSEPKPHWINNLLVSFDSEVRKRGRSRDDANSELALAHVRTLPDHLVAGGDPAAVRLPRAAEFSAALQRGADPAGADRAACRRPAAIRAGALGPDPGLGEGPAHVRAAHQCARRIGAREAGLPQRHAAPALPVSGRRLLRMERAQAAASGRYSCAPKDGGPIAFAGLWETWMGPNGEEMETAAIVTTAANRELARMHDRMPVIVPPEAFDLWLDCRKVDAETAAALIAPARDGLLEAYEMSPAVNRVGNDEPS